MSLLLLLLTLGATPPVPTTSFDDAPSITVGGEGVEPGSMATLVDAPTHSGRGAVRVRYSFLAKPGTLQYVGFGADLSIPLPIRQFTAWVLGDGAGQAINVRLADRTGEIHQFPLGRASHTGWREMAAPVADGELSWGGDGNHRLDPPLTLNLLLVDSSVEPADGEIVFDDLAYRAADAHPPAVALPLAWPAAPTARGWGGAAVERRGDSLALRYNFTNEPGVQQVVVPLDQPLPPTDALFGEVTADGRGQWLLYQVTDAGGEQHLVPYGRLTFTGTTGAKAWLGSLEHAGGDGNGRLDPPLRLTGLVIRRGAAGSGELRFANPLVVPARGEPTEMELLLESCDDPPPPLQGAAVQPGSRLARDTDTKESGAAAWRLDYEFSEAGGMQYLELPLDGSLGVDPRPVRVRVKGDGSANDIRLRVVDGDGEYHQYLLSTLAFDGWRELTCDFTAEHGSWRGDEDGLVEGAVKLNALVIDRQVRPSRGTIWIARIATDVVARAADAIRVAGSPANPAGWYAGEDGRVSLTVEFRDRRPSPPASMELPLRLVITGGGAVQERRELPATLRDGRLTLPLSWDSGGEVGQRDLHLIWELGDDFGTVRLPVANLPRLGPSEPAINPFGACLHYSQRKGIVPLNYELLARGGGAWSRDEYSWGSVERERGVYRFPDYQDGYVTAARRAGIEPLLILDYGNPLYDEGLPPTSDEAQEAFAAYAYQMVSNYRDRVRHWEVWNEPNIPGFWKPAPDPVAYARLLKRTYAACKRADPDCVVVAMATAGTDLKFIEAVLAEGTAEFLDAVSIHPYRYPRSPEESDFVGDLERCHALLERYGIGDKPIWLTEVGWPNQDDRRGSSEEETANYLVRMVSLARSRPYIGPIFWYDFQNDGWDPAYNEDNFGLIRKDFAPKAPYLAAAMMTRVLGAKRFVRDHALPPPGYLHEYEGGGRRTLVAWSTPVPATLRLRLDAAEVEVSDGTGRIETVPVTDGLLTLELGERPIFIDGGFASPSRVEP